MKYDVIIFPVIDWLFRIQRPQQIASELARRGHRVFYLTVVFLDENVGRPYLFLASPDPNVYVVQLRCPSPHPNVYKQIPTDTQKQALLDSLQALCESCSLRNIVSIVDLPFWRQIANAIQGSLLVYDCMDYHPGFLNNEKAMLEEEDRLVLHADLVLTTSEGLSREIGKLRPNTLIRNACDVEHFTPRQDTQVRRRTERPVVGYFGAIDHWYDFDLVVEAARRFSSWDFVLIGNVSGCDTSSAKDIPNIHFIGEVPYQELPEYVHGFDVCIIPFLITELTLYTNPVKLYEYLSAGKPVVGTAMPEIMIGGVGLVYVAENHENFFAKLADAMASHDNPEYVLARQAFARGQTWSNRVDDFEQAVLPFFPPVSVIVLTYNNLHLTKSCLLSIERYSHYPNLELVIVDNASADETVAWLQEFASSRPWVKLVLNRENLGFAAGNNRGLTAASGEYLILLNNDTQVTRGWISDLIRHFRRDPTLGLVGSVTNNIGNEAKIDISYSTPEEMASAARRYVQPRRLQSLPASTIAFFCAAMPREVFAKVGLLDEIFGLGMFEDDDYCRRVEAAGYKVAIAEDVFIHHELSASLDKLGAERKRELFEINKQAYEKKWGAWRPHEYRKVQATKETGAS